MGYGVGTMTRSVPLGTEFAGICIYIKVLCIRSLLTYSELCSVNKVSIERFHKLIATGSKEKKCKMYCTVYCTQYHYNNSLASMEVMRNSGLSTSII